MTTVTGSRQPKIPRLNVRDLPSLVVHLIRSVRVESELQKQTQAVGVTAKSGLDQRRPSDLWRSMMIKVDSVNKL